MRLLTILFLMALLPKWGVAGDIDLANHIKKYWTRWHNRKIEIADGDKRWPLTPELKAERLEHFKSMLSKFAPHIVEETYLIDKTFGWKKGTYLGVLRFGARNIKPLADVPKPEHECTSWITMDNMTGGKEIIMHKNRDSRGRPIAIQRRAVPGKHAWIGNGPQYGLSPSQGINDRGVVVMMNAGDALPEAENSQYGFGVFLICRILLEESGSAEDAVKLLEKIIYSNAHSHVECGSIWFIGDAKNVYIVEHSNRKLVAKKVNSGFIARANAFHYPEMQIYSLRSYKSLIAHSRREFAIRDYLVNTQWRKNGVITALDNAAASRIDKFPDGAKDYPPCGKSTISATTFVIDKEYPEFLSTAYMVFASPASSCYLPVPITLREIPETILDGTFSMRSFDLMDKKQPLLPADKLAVLEKRLYERHQAAVEKVRVLLRTSTGHTVKDDAAKILNDAFAENFKDLQASVK
ncbi:MAG: hypothetical protein E7039_00495 [Lentisphaerae bacterium]|nr:hypothetical protein [Lentisphaerota bacterium]